MVTRLNWEKENDNDRKSFKKYFWGGLYEKEVFSESLREIYSDKFSNMALTFSFLWCMLEIDGVHCLGIRALGTLT